MNEARGKQEENQEPGELESGQDVREDQRRSRSAVWAILRPLGHLGPGLLGGLSGNDSSAVTVYALDGAQAGFGHLWLLVLSTPLYQAVLYTCAKIGRVTQKGLAEILRDSYGPWVALPVCLALIVANIALISADLVAIGAGFNLLTGIDYRLFLIPAALLLWYLTVFGTFRVIKSILLLLSLAFAAYLLTALVEHPEWNAIVLNTVVPHLDGSFASISSAVALLGATISPYTMFWQVQGEREVRRPGELRQQIRFVALDMAAGALSGNLIAYFIIVSSAHALFSHHGENQRGIQTAADVARALSPIVGPYASLLFALGLIAAAVVAIPILLASTSDAIAGSFGWPGGISKNPWECGGFYLILSVALLLSLALAFLGVNPIQLIFWANILCELLAPLLVISVLLIGNSRSIMGMHRVGWMTNGWLGLTVLVLLGGAVLFFYSLFTGGAGS